MQALINKTKKIKLFKPIIPFARSFRRKFSFLKNYSEYKLERNRSLTWSKTQDVSLSKKIELSIEKVKQKKGYFGGWAISEHSLRYFTQLVFKNCQEPTIFEFGSGQSTYYWNFLLNQTPFEVHTFEHHPFWVEYSKKNNDLVHMHHSELLQISDDQKSKMFLDIFRAQEHFDGRPIPKSEWDNTRIKNSFYDIGRLNFLSNQQKIDGILLDGPNGNGRSLCFPLILPYLKKGALILIDDFIDYPFIDELSQIAEFNILMHHKCPYPKDNWCILEYISIKN